MQGGPTVAAGKTLRGRPLCWRPLETSSGHPHTRSARLSPPPFFVRLPSDRSNSFAATHSSERERLRLLFGAQHHPLVDVRRSRRRFHFARWRRSRNEVSRARDSQIERTLSIGQKDSVCRRRRRRRSRKGQRTTKRRKVTYKRSHAEQAKQQAKEWDKRGPSLSGSAARACGSGAPPAADSK